MAFEIRMTKRERELEQADKEGYTAYSPRYSANNPYKNNADATLNHPGKAIAWDAGYARRREENNHYW